MTLIACGGHSKGADAGHTHDAGADAGKDGGAPDAGPGDAGPICVFGAPHGEGYSCNVDSDCTTGRCFFPLNLGTLQPVSGYCAQPCTMATPDCSSGFSCVTAADLGDSVCGLADGGVPLPADGTLPFGSPCFQDSDCMGDTAFCGDVVSSDGLTEYSFCSGACDNSMPGSCGSCGSCVEPASGGSPQCQPQGSGAIGSACETRTDCSSFDCRGFCTIQCAGGGMTPIACPSGDQCEPINESPSLLALCVNPAQINATASGGTCTYDFQCTSGDTCHIPTGASAGTCQAGSGLGAVCTDSSNCAGNLSCLEVSLGAPNTQLSADLNVCTAACKTNSDCGASAACVAIDFDTNLNIWNATDAGPGLFAANDDINPMFGDRWSEVSQQPFPAGTYWLQVSAYGQSQGNYVLSVTNGTSATGTTAETTSPHGSFAAAQTITVPTTVDGAFTGPGVEDYYEFTLNAPATLTIEVSRGAPSLCLPNSSVGQVPWGSGCSTDWQCASTLCEQVLQTCGQPCGQNSDCGGINVPDAGPSDAGYYYDAGPADAGPTDAGPADAGQFPICADFQTHHSCVMPGAYGQLGLGATCDYSFQCANGACADFCGAIFCTQPCSGLGDNCGIVVGGMSQNECAPLTTSPSGAAVSDFACVTTGQMSCSAGAACASAGDCQSDHCNSNVCE